MTAIPTTARSKAEKARRHALENHDKQMKLVQEIELKLADAVTERWTPESDEWVHAEQLLSRREFQQALDHLEGLILARLFELTKVHQSQTGMSPYNSPFRSYDLEISSQGTNYANISEKPCSDVLQQSELP